MSNKFNDIFEENVKEAAEEGLASGKYGLSEAEITGEFSAYYARYGVNMGGGARQHFWKIQGILETMVRSKAYRAARDAMTQD